MNGGYYLDNSRKGDDEASPTKKVKGEDSQENTGMLTRNSSST